MSAVSAGPAASGRISAPSGAIRPEGERVSPIPAARVEGVRRVVSHPRRVRVEPIPFETVRAPSPGVSPRVVLTRRGRQLRFLLLLMIGLLLFVILAVINSEKTSASEVSARPASLVVYVVEAGDTLWGIARRYDAGVDPRETVRRIRHVNGLSGAQIDPGQVLVMPAR